jgi:hypothetical protein
MTSERMTSEEAAAAVIDVLEAENVPCIRSHHAA